jgi:hypothetical protein
VAWQIAAVVPPCRLPYTTTWPALLGICLQAQWLQVEALRWLLCLLPLASAPPQLTDDLTGDRNTPTEFNINFFSGAPTFQPSSMDFGTFLRGAYVGGELPAAPPAAQAALSGAPWSMLAAIGSPLRHRAPPTLRTPL